MRRKKRPSRCRQCRFFCCRCPRGPRGATGATGPAGPTGPTGPTGSASLLQTRSVQQGVDTSTASAGFTTLLSTPITLAGGTKLTVAFYAAFTHTTPNTSVRFRIRIDGSFTVGLIATNGGSSVVPAAGLQSCVSLLQEFSGLGAGTHLVEIMWATTAPTASIRAFSFPDFEGADMIASEVAA